MATQEAFFPYKVTTRLELLQPKKDMEFQVNSYMIKRSLSTPKLLLAFNKETRRTSVVSKWETNSEEFELLTKIQHKNIFPVLEVIRPLDSLYTYVVGDFEPKAELFSFDRKKKKCKPMKPALIDKYFGQLVSVLLYLKGTKVALLNLKPENVLLLQGESKIMVSDLSCAVELNKHAESKAPFDADFSAPELALPDTSGLDLRKCDVFSFGKMLQFALYGSLKPKSSLDFKIKRQLSRLFGEDLQRHQIMQMATVKDPDTRATITTIADEGHFFDFNLLPSI